MPSFQTNTHLSDHHVKITVHDAEKAQTGLADSVPRSLVNETRGGWPLGGQWGKASGGSAVTSGVLSSSQQPWTWFSVFCVADVETGSEVK